MRGTILLPKVLIEEEVTHLISAVTNLKHRCILMLIYSTGLRLSESVHVRLDDLLLDRNQIFIKGGKGKTCAEPAEVKTDMSYYLLNYLIIC